MSSRHAATLGAAVTAAAAAAAGIMDFCKDKNVIFRAQIKKDRRLASQCEERGKKVNLSLMGTKEMIPFPRKNEFMVVARWYKQPYHFLNTLESSLGGKEEKA